MPNWCYNKLTVKSNGNKIDFIHFMEQGYKMEIIEGEEILVWRISNYLPTPSELLKEQLNEKEQLILLEKYGFKNSFDWREFYWGTKWDCDDYGFESTTDGVSFYELDFDSAWSPPIEWIINVSIIYPTLSFQLEYFEPGCSFAGVCLLNDGMFLDLCCEPVLKNDNGEIIEVNYDEDNELYLLPDGQVFDEDNWFDNELSQPKNPFDGFNLN